MRYLQRLEGSRDDKLRVINAMPDQCEYVLDVGCADGSITSGMASLMPDTTFVGLDINLPFVMKARAGNRLPNVGYEQKYLAELQQYDTKYDAICFMSVLHEIYSYGKGLTSVIKTLSDAYELLRPGGRLIIRDMLWDGRDKYSDPVMRFEILDKLKSIQAFSGCIEEFDYMYDLQTHGWLRLNDLLLHLLYRDNWMNELKEEYMFWTIQEYVNFLQGMLNMEVIARESYVLEYVGDRWRKEFWLNQMEISNLASTGILVMEK